VQQGRVQPPRFRLEAEDFAANSPVSPVDRVAFVDGTVQRGLQTEPTLKLVLVLPLRTIALAPLRRARRAIACDSQ